MTRPVVRTSLDAPLSMVFVSEVLFAVGYQTSTYPQDQRMEVTGTESFVFSQFIY